MELQGGQGHPGRARGTQGKVPRAPWGPPGFRLAWVPLPGLGTPPWVPLASKKEKMGSTLKISDFFVEKSTVAGRSQGGQKSPK